MCSRQVDKFWCLLVFVNPYSFSWLLSDFLGSEVSVFFVGMVTVSGPSAKASEEDQERTRRLADAEMHRHHLESLLEQREREVTALREVSPIRIFKLSLDFVIIVFNLYNAVLTGTSPSLRGNPRIYQNKGSTDCYRYEGATPTMVHEYFLVITTLLMLQH